MNVKRFTVCLLSHKWTKVRYPGEDDTGFFIRCLRCGHENHDIKGSSAATGSPLGM